MDVAVMHAPSPQHWPRESNARASGLASGMPSSPAQSGLLQRAFSQMQGAKGTGSPINRSSSSVRRPLSFADAALELKSIAELDLGSLDLSDFPEAPGQPAPEAAGGQAPEGT